MGFHVGAPIWAYKEWVGSFFPAGTKPGEYLREYSRRLTTVEGNTTFYAVPSAKILQEWVESTPESFRFCPKLPRTISHAGKLVDNIEEGGRFIDVMSALGKRLGPMFLQLPPRYSPGWLDDLKAFLEEWPADVQLAVEVRHTDWFSSPHNEELNELLAKKHMARVIVDTRPIRSLRGEKILENTVYKRLLEAQERQPKQPIMTERTTTFTFLRFIGHPEIETNTPAMSEWATNIASWLSDDMDAYIFCHCPDERTDPWLCRRLYQMVSDKIRLPPLPWDEADATSARQTRLF